MRILLIEEDDFALTILTTKLKDSFNCQIDQVRYGQKGLRLLKFEKPYDLIIADSFSVECLGFELMQFHERHSISGRFVFFTNAQKLEHSIQHSNVEVVSRICFENLRIFISDQFAHKFHI